MVWRQKEKIPQPEPEQKFAQEIEGSDSIEELEKEKKELEEKLKRLEQAKQAPKETEPKQVLTKEEVFALLNYHNRMVAYYLQALGEA